MRFEEQEKRFTRDVKIKELPGYFLSALIIWGDFSELKVQEIHILEEEYEQLVTADTTLEKFLKDYGIFLDETNRVKIIFEQYLYGYMLTFGNYDQENFYLTGETMGFAQPTV